MSGEKAKTEVFLTKYCLANGEIQRASKLVEETENGLTVPGWQSLKHKAKDFAFTESEAIQFAEHLRMKKIASLQKQLARLENLKFTVV